MESESASGYLNAVACAVLSAWEFTAIEISAEDSGTLQPSPYFNWGDGNLDLTLLSQRKR